MSPVAASGTAADDVVTKLLGFPLPTGTEIYDEIMQRIDPELVSANLEHLDEPYGDESEDERKKRYERYGKAFTDYQKVYAVWSKNFQNAVKEYRRALVKTAESLSKEDEDAAMQLLESQILAA
jgi:hypothetical protein